MDYLEGLLKNSTEGICELVTSSLESSIVSKEDIKLACKAEIEAELVKDQFYSLDPMSIDLLNKLNSGTDKNMCTVVKKILKSTKLASHTFRDPTEIKYVDLPLNVES